VDPFHVLLQVLRVRKIFGAKLADQVVVQAGRQVLQVRLVRVEGLAALPAFERARVARLEDVAAELRPGVDFTKRFRLTYTKIGERRFKNI
jgi:hypothetical protein